MPPYTIQQLLPAVRTLLRRPSEAELSDNDIREAIQDELSGLVQDMDLGDRQHRTDSAYLEMVEDADQVDFFVTVPDVPDFEPVRLEYGSCDINGVFSPLTDDVLVDFNNFASQARQGQVVAAFYSGRSLGGLKLRTNVDLMAALNATWRLWYRVPLLAVVQMGASPPIPTNFMPMVKYGVAIRCFPVVRRNSDEWRIFKRETLPQYEAEYLTWNNPGNLQRPGRWRDYLDKHVGSQIVRLPRFDDHRRRTVGSTRGYMPRGRPQ